MDLLPVSLGDLTGLQFLSFYSNEFSSSLPSEMGNLVNLKFLDLHDNHFSGSLPASIGSLNVLEQLLMQNNEFTGEIPEEWGNLSSLIFLRMAVNHLTGPIPTSFGNLSNLANLILGNNELSGEIPSELGDLSNLINLDLRFNRLTGTIPISLGGLPSLQILYLQHNSLSGSIPSELGGLSMLRELAIQSSGLTGEIPEELGNLTNLYFLWLHQNQLSGPIPSTLGNLQNLKYLRLETNRLSGSIPVEMGALTQLLDLNINGNMLAGPIPPSLTNLTALTTTNIGYNALYTSDETLITFLNTKDPDWAATQTTAPTQVTATSLDNAIVLVSWLPIPYTANAGYYKVMISGAAGGPYLLAGQTTNKLTSSVQVAGLTPGITYYFVVKTLTQVCGGNQNIVESEYSAEVSATPWLQLHVQISGTVRLGGSPLSGVVMSGLAGDPVTDALGAYSVTVDAGWSGTVTPTLAPFGFEPALRTIPLAGDQLAQDYTALPIYTLAYAAGANGTVTGELAQTVNHGGSGAAVEAVPNTGYHFVDWSDGVLTATRTDTNVIANLSVTANFAIDTFTLTYTAGDRRDDHRHIAPNC